MKQCEFCGQDFEPGYRPRQKYCTPAHKTAAASARYRRNNPDQSRLHEKRKREKFADRINARTKRWREENRDYVLENGRRRHHENREAANTGRRERFSRMMAEKPWHRMLHVAKCRAKKKGVPYSLTPEWAEAAWTGKCALTDIPFVPAKNHGGFYSPSIDRIKPKLGYTPENCRFVLHSVNCLKGIGSDLDVLLVVTALAKSLAISTT